MRVPFKVGFGYDVHRLEEGYDLWLGGIKLDHTHGLEGHSDADVALHAISDALLGATALGDIGHHFPPTDERFKGADSKLLLREVCRLVRQTGYEIANVDVTITAERPKIKPHIPTMRRVISEVMAIDEDQISIKATTSERLGFTGREEGMSAYAVALVYLP